jgi:plastocyanin
MKIKTIFFTTVLCLALQGGRGGELYAQSSYKEVTVSNGGTIQGRVRFSGDLPKKMRMVISKDEKYCGVSKVSPRLTVGKTGGLQSAVVWLEGVSEGKKNVEASKRLVLNQARCEYTPHILILPFGSSLDIVNSDPVLHNVHACDEGDNLKALFNIAQPIKGQRTTVKHTQFKKPGLYLATCDAGHPWMNAYIMVAEHPYYALTDANGYFILDNIPPGTYKLKMWHEGVAVVKTEMENGKPKSYRYEAPYEEAKDVTVSSSGKVNVDFSFSLRDGETNTVSRSNSVTR